MTEDGKARVYVSIPIEILTREEAKKLQAELAGLLDPETQEPVFNDVALDMPEHDPQKSWKHLSNAMRLLGECDAIIFDSSDWYYPALTGPIEFDAAIRHGMTCLHTWRDLDKKLRLLDMPHSGGPEKNGEE